jgi:hypothetical protein
VVRHQAVILLAYLVMRARSARRSWAGENRLQSGHASRRRRISTRQPLLMARQVLAMARALVEPDHPRVADATSGRAARLRRSGHLEALHQAWGKTGER